jgi:ribosomal protein S18 acetylase RimI-like enzyme
MSHTLTVREFKASEWTFYKSLRLRSLEESPNAFGSTLELELQRTDEVWAERIHNAATSGKDCALLAELDGEAVGLVWAKVNATAQDHANIFQMWVSPEARGRGVGSALLTAALEWCRSRAVTVVKLGVTCGDTPAVRLYRRAGFYPYGATEPLRQGSGFQAQNMRLSLGTEGAA